MKVLHNEFRSVDVRLLMGASTIVLILFGSMSDRALAQSTDTSSGTGVAVETVEVSATRVVRDGYSAPTPTTVLDADLIGQQAPANLADLVNNLPALADSPSPRTQLGLGGPTDGMNLLNLRSLGANRTLVLVDGQRITPSTATMNVDVNLLPTALVKRVDVVTGGTSADWGSDSVAGVVNFILDKNYNGLKGNIQGGVTEYGDGKTIEGSLTYGMPFADGKGHFEISAQYHNQGEVGGPANTGRSWYQGWKIIANPNGTATDILLPHVGFSLATYGGLITSGPLKGTQFTGLTGIPAPFNFGFVSGNSSVNGTAEDVGVGQMQLQDPQQDGAMFARANYDLTPDVTMYTEVNYAKSHLVGQSVTFSRAGNLTINSGNPFLPASVQAAMTANKLASFSFGTSNQELGFLKQQSDTETSSFNVGFDGRLGDRWTWDAHYVYGQFYEGEQFLNDVNTANYNFALNAVVDPTTGQIVCSSTVAQAAGCVPMDAFGTGQISQAAKNYVTGTSIYDLTTTQSDAAANLQGEPFSTWAGPVSVAAGGEYRREYYKVSSSALDQASSFYLGNTLPANGKYNVFEGYAETVVPLLSGVTFAKELDFNSAVRVTDYSINGTVETWKAGLTYDVYDDLRLRAVRSTDIRAPNLNDLFAAGVSGTGAVTDTLTGTSPQIKSVTSGNTALSPEVANTTSGGFVYQPHWLPGLLVSADYFGIHIHNAIVTPTAQQVVTSCNAGDTRLCADITRGSNNVITAIHITPANEQSETTSGFDLGASYKTDISDIISDWGGGVTFRANVTDTMDHTVCALGACAQYAGTNGDANFADPRWRSLVSATYELDSFSATITGRYIGGGVITNRTPAVVNNGVPSTTYVDLAGSYKFENGWQPYFVIENLADTPPPPTPQVSTSISGNIGANAFIYDVLGRQFRVGVRFQF